MLSPFTRKPHVLERGEGGSGAEERFLDAFVSS
jgi:hypothetical protein